MVAERPPAVLDRIGAEVWALIPARSGSKGIVDKNLQEVSGVSLLGLSVLAGTTCAAVSRCFVSTDSAAYAREGKRFGAEVPFLRPPRFATDTSTDLDVFLHFLDWAATDLGYLPWAIVHLRPTTPCRKPDTIEDVIRLAMAVAGASSAVRSVHEAAESPFKWFRRDGDGYLTRFDGSRELDASNEPRADYETVYVPNGYADVIYPAQLLRSGRLHGDAVRPYITEQVIEVDSQFELDLLRRADSLPRALLTAAAEAIGIPPTEGHESPC